MSNNNKRFALSHIYTNMTFGLFSNIASMALWNILTNMSHHPVSTPHRACIIRRLSGLYHPAPAGYASSGSHRVLFIQFSAGTHHPAPAGYSFIRSLPGTLHPVLTGSSSSGPDISSGGSEIPTYVPSSGK